MLVTYWELSFLREKKEEEKVITLLLGRVMFIKFPKKRHKRYVEVQQTGNYYLCLVFQVSEQKMYKSFI